MSFFKNLFFALTKKEQVLFFISGAVATVSFIVVASAAIADITKAIPSHGGTYTEGLVGQPEYVNPVTAQSEADLSLVKLTYANIPDLANTITTSPDGKTWTIHLKDGLTWQDGQKITSDDIIFTVQSIQNQDAKSPLASSWQGVTANRVSELELNFTLTNPYAFFNDNLKNLYPVPKHIFADVPVGNWRLSDFNLKPIGDGPYKFISYDEQTDGFIPQYHLVAWDDYAGQKTLINNLNLAFFRNTTDLIKSFNSGSIDGFGTAMPSILKDSNRPLDVFTWRTPGYYAVFFNESKNLALQDADVRNALSLAIDRSAITTNAFDSYGVPSNGPIPPDAPYFTSIDASSSPDRASSTLTRAGWIVNTDTGFRAKLIQKTSVPLTINLTVPDIAFLVKTAQALQAAWQSIGIQTNIATDTPQNLVTTTIKNRNYETLLFGNVLGPSSDLYSFWDSSQRFSPGLNLAIYQNKKVDSLIEDARRNMSIASRTQEFAQIQQIIVSDNPALFLFSPDYLSVTNKNIQGIAPKLLADPSDRWREITSWYLGTVRVLK